MEKKEFLVKIMFYIMLKSLDEIAKVDEDFQEDLEEIDATIQWKIGKIRGYQTFKGGKYFFEIDKEADNPDLTMVIEDYDVAKRFFTGDLDGTAAFMSGDLKLDGDIQLALEYSSFADLIREYLKFI